MATGVNYAVCNHIDENSNSICGAMATEHIELIKDIIPPMPVCSKHVGLYTDEKVQIALAQALFDMFAEGDEDGIS